jgi:uncharacterized phage-associated protein
MILDDVYSFFGQYTASRLRQMTHEEAPWKDAYIQDANELITVEALRSYFSNEVNEEYRRKYGELQRRQA